MSIWENWRRGRGLRTSGFDMSTGTSPVRLTRRQSTLSLTRQGADSGTMRINLSWRMLSSGFETASRPLWRNPLSVFKPEVVRAPTQAVVSVDLDLACMYELADGSKGVVQPLGELYGELNAPPYVKLSGDDRFGSGSGETMYINLDHADEIQRLLIFVYIYDGTPAFSRTSAVVTLVPSSGPQIEVSLDERAPQARSCAVALIERVKDELVVRREVRYVYGFQSELDHLYGWGLQWGRATKSGRV